MDSYARRSFLKEISALAAIGFPGIAAAKAKSYDPAARYELRVTEVPFRKNAQGRQLMARIYEPQGAGPFPVVLDLHGGAWQRKDRKAEEPMDRAIAASGVLVVAIDITLSGEAPYPAAVQDASYGVRWLKARAPSGKAIRRRSASTAARAAATSPSSSPCARTTRATTPSRWQNTPGADTRVAYVATRSPISDPYARWQQAERKKNENLIKASKTFFQPWETIHEANPQEMLERKETVALRPLLIMQGELDDNVLPAVQEKFASTYRAAGGDVQYELFANSVHEWVAEPGPQTTRAHEMVKAFIARQLAA